MRQAMVAAEDARFYAHNGVDLKAVARAFVNNQRGGDLQGASTLRCSTSARRSPMRRTAGQPSMGFSGPSRRIAFGS
jgi:membrane carboxypeptidase/penicillin-binding protein PbpC